jgi:hypothetical protein
MPSAGRRCVHVQARKLASLRADDEEGRRGHPLLGKGRRPDTSGVDADERQPNGIPRPRDKPRKIAFRPGTVSAETETRPQMPAICRLPGRLRESRGKEECVVGPGGFEPALTVGLRAHCTRGRGRAPRPIQWGTDRWGVVDLGLVLVAQRRGLHPLHGCSPARYSPLKTTSPI